MHTAMERRVSFTNKAVSDYMWAMPLNSKASSSSHLVIIFVHGCAEVDPKLAGSLRKSAERIHHDVSPRQTHIVSYNASKLLRVGQPIFGNLRNALFDFLKHLCSKTAPLTFAFVAHNTGVWLVQDVISQWRNESEGETLESMPVPVGLVMCGLPTGSSKASWDASGWETFCGELMKQFKKEDRRHNKREEKREDKIEDKREGKREDKKDDKKDSKKVRLECSVIKQSMFDFEAFVLDVDLPCKNVAHSSHAMDPEEKNMSGLRRRFTSFSHTSTSSIKSVENISIGYVRLHRQEEEEIAEFLNSGVNQKPYRIQRPVAQMVPKSTSTQQETNDMSSLSKGSEGENSRSQSRPDSLQKTTDSEEQRRGNIHRPVDQNTAFKEWPEQATQSPSNHHKDQDKSGLSPNNREVNESRKLALWYFEQGDLGQAKRLYTSVSGKDESYRDIHHNLAKISWIDGHYKEAEEVFKKLLNSAQDISEDTSSSVRWTYDVVRWLALTYWKRGKYDLAARTIEECRKRVRVWKSESSDESDSEPPTLLSTLALVRAAKGDFKAAWKLSKKAAADAKRLSSRIPAEQADYRFCLLNHARISSEVGEFKEAEEKSKEVFRDLQEYLGPKHFVTLDAASLRVWLMVLRNNPTQVEEEIQKTLRQIKELLGENHPSTLQAVQTLILLYKGDGRYVDAEVTARYLVEKCEKNPELESLHPQTLKSKAILAEVLLATGKWSEAESILRGILKEEKDNFLFETSLADILRVKGDWDGARGMAIEVLCKEIQRFSRDDETEDDPEVYEGEKIEVEELQEAMRLSGYITRHLSEIGEGGSPFKNRRPVGVYPALVRTLHCVALCEQVRDDADLAFVDSILNLLLRISQKKLGTDHRLTLSLEYDLAVNLRLRGQVKESLEKLNGIVDARRKFLGADHPDYLVSRYQRAVTLSRCFQWQKALEEHKAVLKVQEALLGVSHFDTVMTRYSLVEVYHSLNSLTEASDLITRVISDQERLYKGSSSEDLDHPLVIRSLCKYALILLGQGQASAAERVQMRVYEQRQKMLSDGNSLTRSAKIDLAQIKQVLGYHQAAIDIYMELQAALKDPDSQTGYQLQTSLASCYFEMGKFGSAKDLQVKLYKDLKSTTGDSGLNTRLIIAAFNLALTCKEIARREKARHFLAKAAYALLFEAASIADRVYGKYHPRTEELCVTRDVWKKDLLSQGPSQISESDVKKLEDNSATLSLLLEPQSTNFAWSKDSKDIPVNRNMSALDSLGTKSTTTLGFKHTESSGIGPTIADAVLRKRDSLASESQPVHIH